MSHLDTCQVHCVAASVCAAPDCVLPLQQLQADDAHGRLAVSSIQVLRHAPNAVLFRHVVMLVRPCSRLVEADIAKIIAFANPAANIWYACNAVHKADVGVDLGRLQGTAVAAHLHWWLLQRLS